MAQEKEKTETEETTGASPPVQTKPEAPDKLSGPQSAPAESSRAMNGAEAAPALARTADQLSAQRPGTTQLARMAGSMQHSVGNARLGRMLGTGVQRKTEVSSPEDTSEKEADEVAENVMRMSDTEPASPGAPMGGKPRPDGEGGQPMSKSDRGFMEPRFGRSFENVRLHTDRDAQREATGLGARAFTRGSDISFAAGSGPDDKKLLAHELTHVVQQEGSNPSTGRKIHRHGGVAHLVRLDEMLDMFDVPEESLITLLSQMNRLEKAYVVSGYQGRIASVLNVEEMVRAVNILGPPLETKLRWVEMAASSRSAIDYSDIRAMVTSAPQPQRNSLKTSWWQGVFVDICTNATMFTAVNDLHFDLTTKLQWMLAEGTDYEHIVAVIRLAPTSELPGTAANAALINSLRDELSTARFRIVYEMLTLGLLQQGPVERQTDTGNKYSTWLRHTRGLMTISKDVNFVEAGAFGAGGFNALRSRVIAAVTSFLSRKYKVKIQSRGGAAQVGDGEYPIAVVVRHSASAAYSVNLHGGAHGRSGVTEAGGNIYELGQATETSVPDITLAHESAHMILGASDEYANAAVPARVLYTDHSLMGDFYSEGIAQAEIKARHFQFLVEYISKYFPDRNITIERVRP